MNFLRQYDTIKYRRFEKSHANGIRCNVFWSDDLKETEEFLDMGIDAILTNDYQVISQAIKNRK